MKAAMTRQRFTERKIVLLSAVQLATALALLPNLPLDPAYPLEVVVRERVKGRKLDQNALYWAGPLRDIADQAWLDGKQFTAETWAHFFKREFLPEDELVPDGGVPAVLVNRPIVEGLSKDKYAKWDFTPDGERILVGSSTQLTIRGFALYLEQVIAFGASLGVQFSASPNEGRP